MKNETNEILFGRSLKLSALLALGVFVLVGLGCFGIGRKSSILSENKQTVSNIESGNAVTNGDDAAPPITKFSGKKADASKGEMPSDEEMQQIVRTSMLDFNDAVQQGDFAAFYGKISKTWQKQITPATFNSTFGEFISHKVDFSEVGTLDADFSSPPAINRSMGVKTLVAQGKYNTTPLPTKFDLKYIPDGKDWKLFGIEVDTRDY